MKDSDADALCQGKLDIPPDISLQTMQWLLYRQDRNAAKDAIPNPKTLTLTLTISLTG